MAAIKNIDNLSVQQLKDLVDQGGKFVMFQYTISVLVATFRNPTDIYFIRPGEGTTSYSIGSTLITLLFGWWGIPWGPIYSIGTLVTNMSGGKDVTSSVMQDLLTQHTAAQNAAGISQSYNIPNSQSNGNNSNNSGGSSSYNIPR